MKNIRPLKPSNKVLHTKPKPKAKVRSAESEADQPMANHDFSFQGLLTHDDIKSNDFLSWASPSISGRNLKKLKDGELAIEAQLDLHGLQTETAYQTMLCFIEESIEENNRCILIVHGKGSLNQNEPPKLKNLAYYLLQSHPDVLAFCSALPKHGGVGAVYVWLKKRG